MLAIGNPFGLDQTLTTGVISGLGREIKSVTQRSIFDVIQTDASINPGNSGGPLLDSAGRLIGINTAIYSPSGANAGIGFAVPVDTVNAIVPQLIKHGKLTRPGLGINILSDQIAAQQKIDGVVILGVTPGGAADQAGIAGTQPDAAAAGELGDVIVQLDGTEVQRSSDLFRALDAHKVGDEVELTVENRGPAADGQGNLASTSLSSTAARVVSPSSSPGPSAAIPPAPAPLPRPTRCGATPSGGALARSPPRRSSRALAARGGAPPGRRTRSATAIEVERDVVYGPTTRLAPPRHLPPGAPAGAVAGRVLRPRRRVPPAVEGHALADGPRVRAVRLPRRQHQLPARAEAPVPGGDRGHVRRVPLARVADHASSAAIRTASRSRASPPAAT